MPNSNDRKKKDGRNVGKTIQARKEGEAERKVHAQRSAPDGDQGDIMNYKPGSASDRTRTGAT
jgi:hypothetical protein